ncbi:hypothetical protein [Fervidobacterium thailandense]|uniref:Uncharacterized protein n=1 Tax=Fervidobacterium thailandense TaxID=1008305 RepID=A0A1E3G111_9BACT|nr:hypothetical protein [Fervidobacterium thailandense]ODN29917.1 hypothetical protein A4H02_08285 [Fervidobacterium thailandense]
MTNLLSNVRSFLRSIMKTLFEIIRTGRKSNYTSKTVTLAIIHFDGQNFDELIRTYREELKAASIIVAKNVPPELVKAYKNVFHSKDIVLLGKEIYVRGSNVDFAKEVQVNKLRSFEKRRLHVLVTDNKKTAWMISQMFPFYCVCPGEPFEETVITAPIPLTRNSDGYYFSKVPYRSQVTLIDLNIDIIREFSK